MILIKEAMSVTLHALERGIRTRLDDLHRDAYRDALARTARRGRASWLGRRLRAWAEWCDGKRSADGPWREDFGARPLRT